MSLKHEVEAELKKIEPIIRQYYKTENNISLMDGIGAVPIFFDSLYKLTNDKKFEKETQNSLDFIFAVLNKSKDNNFSVFEGLTGIAFSFHILIKSRIRREKELVETLFILDDIILEYTKNNLFSKNDMDFLHGSLGAIFYLNERVALNPKIKKSTHELYIKSCKLLNEYISYLDKLNQEKAIEKFQFGLAHGCASFISVFCKGLYNYPDCRFLKNSIIVSVNYLLKYESKKENHISFFPGKIHDNLGYNMPLSWCNGDQGIAYSLYKASKVLKDESLFQKFLQIIEKTEKRNTLEKSIYSEDDYYSGLCHGVSSIGYLHKKTFEITSDKRFYNLYNYFTKELVKRHRLTLNLIEEIELMEDNKKPNLGLLNGLTGIGLYYIDFLNPKSKPFWEGSFLLD